MRKDKGLHLQGSKVWILLQVHYVLSLAANRGACGGLSQCHMGNVEVKTRQYDDNLVINTTVLAAFGCASTVLVSSY